MITPNFFRILTQTHSQALGQCAGFRSRRLLEAAAIKVNSTAAAAKAVAENSSADCAAICSSVCASVYDGLEVLATDIQDENSTPCMGASICN